MSYVTDDSEAEPAKRERTKIRRVAASNAPVLAQEGRARKSPADPTAPRQVTLWFDAREATRSADSKGVFERMIHASYTGVVVYPDQLDALLPQIPARLLRIVHVDDAAAFAALPPSARGLVIASGDVQALDGARAAGHPTCYRAFVDDGTSLHASIEVGARHPYVMIRFRDPTNIPLELVIASLQATDTILVKEIGDPEDLEDAVVSLGVMEVGADGVMYSPRRHELLDQLTTRLSQLTAVRMAVEVATIVRSEPAGMGYRSCIDVATLFQPDEGMLVGSTSRGGILCCPEVFFLPYMELRPFRVNAGAVHSYVYNFNDRTDYMTELRAGAPVMIVGTDGRTRRATVGRMKTEVRPLRLIEAEFADKSRVNVLMQDDWHVRVFSADGKPLNITELKLGDQVLGHRTSPGRHVGIRIDERILEE